MYVPHDEFVAELAALIMHVPADSPTYCYVDPEVSSAYWIARLLQEPLDEHFRKRMRYEVTSVDDMDPDDVDSALSTGTHITVLFIDDALYSGQQQEGRLSFFVESCVKLADAIGVARQTLMDVFTIYVLAVYASEPALSLLTHESPRFLKLTYRVDVMPHILTSRGPKAAPMFEEVDTDGHVERLPALFFDHKVANTTKKSIAPRLRAAGLDADRSPVADAFPSGLGTDLELQREMLYALRHR